VHAAVVFLGDTGSVAVGGSIVALAFLLKSVLLVLFL
jgi:UDP-N-acetylmuramyl pentapeptide phosphotransferase/UDP-N-acetylglucosamine-1-phosphate transferase